MKVKHRVQGAEESRFQVKGMEFKTLEPSKPRNLEPYFCMGGVYARKKRSPSL
jgi:hypothetical protein